MEGGPIYDSIIIGGSPICMTEAVHLHLKGKKVLLIEKTDLLGGAWQTTEMLGYDNVDVGCHILNHDQQAFDFLGERIGCNMVVMEPQPKKLAFGMHLPYDSWKFKLLVFFNDFIPTFYRKDLKFGKLISHLKSAISIIIRPKKVYQFPKSGASEMINNLRKLVSDNNIEVQFNQVVDFISYDAQTASVHLKNGSILKCKEVVIAAGTELDKIVSPEKEFLLPIENRSFPHLCLTVQDETKSTISYAQIWDHPLIDRINDYTSFVKPIKNVESKEKVLMLLLNDSYKFSPKDLGEIIEFLKKVKILGEGAILKDHKSIEYIVPHRKSETIAHIGTDCKPFVRPLKSNNLSYSFGENKKRWEESIPLFKMS